MPQRRGAGRPDNQPGRRAAGPFRPRNPRPKDRKPNPSAARPSGHGQRTLWRPVHIQIGLEDSALCSAVDIIEFNYHFLSVTLPLLRFGPVLQAVPTPVPSRARRFPSTACLRASHVLLPTAESSAPHAMRARSAPLATPPAPHPPLGVGSAGLGGIHGVARWPSSLRAHRWQCRCVRHRWRHRTHRHPPPTVRPRQDPLHRGHNRTLG